MMLEIAGDKSPLRDALANCRRHFVLAGAFSAISNLLYLAPSLFMLQIYDRVVPTGGIATLVSLGIVTLVALMALGTFEWLRARILIRASAQLEHDMGEQALRASMGRPELSRMARSEIMRDFSVLRQGIASPAVVAALDAPWTIIYVAAAFLLHPALGVMTIVAAILLLALAWANERGTARPMKLAGEASTLAYARQTHATNHAAEVRALGMVSALARLQMRERGRADTLQINANFAATGHLSIVKFLRLALQSGVLALGAALVIDNAISAGAMIAASLLMARALAPIEQAVGSWKAIGESRHAYSRLATALRPRHADTFIALPAPKGSIQVENLTVLAADSDRVALADASFVIAAGEIIGLVGPSGAGKTTLLRTMAGASQATRGHVRFDEASRAAWDPERLARHIGYLPQDSVLFPGSIRDNIARFGNVVGDNVETLDRQVIDAATAVGAHEMIVRLPQGYATQIGPGSIGLSAGQTQRIALARAVFGNPAVLLLDEPTAHLDAEAQQAFTTLLAELRQRRTTVLFSSHSPDALATVDKLLVLGAGRVQRLAPAAELRPREMTPPASPVGFNRRNTVR